MDEAVILTREGYENLKEELVNLKTVRRKEVAERLKQAIDFGDLSENSEYDDAKNEQAFIEGRIQTIEAPCHYGAARSGRRRVQLPENAR